MAFQCVAGSKRMSPYHASACPSVLSVSVSTPTAVSGPVPRRTRAGNRRDVARRATAMHRRRSPPLDATIIWTRRVRGFGDHRADARRGSTRCTSASRTAARGPRRAGDAVNRRGRRSGSLRLSPSNSSTMRAGASSRDARRNRRRGIRPAIFQRHATIGALAQRRHASATRARSPRCRQPRAARSRRSRRRGRSAWRACRTRW